MNRGPPRKGLGGTRSGDAIEDGVKRKWFKKRRKKRRRKLRKKRRRRSR